MSELSSESEMPRVEILGGIISAASKITDAAGTRRDFTDIGKAVFFVDVVDEEGTRICMWDGENYETAIRTAYEVAEEWGFPVHDNLLGGGHEAP